MSRDADLPGTGGPTPATGSAAKRLVLAVYEQSGRGAAALREAAELAAAGAELIVVTLAPQAKPSRCCGGGGAGPYNCAVRDLAAEELAQARTLLGSLADRATFATLVGAPVPLLAACAAERSFDVILVPRSGLGRSGGRLARELRRATDAEVRAVA
jgi:hypothetical protein